MPRAPRLPPVDAPVPPTPQEDIPKTPQDTSPPALISAAFQQTLAAQRAGFQRFLAFQQARLASLSPTPSPHTDQPQRRTLYTGEVLWDQAALLRITNGPPAWFGDQYADFPPERRLMRLPQVPFDFLTRIVDAELDHRADHPARVWTEWDVPAEHWGFRDYPYPELPWVALLETALQSCGWLVAAIGVPLLRDHELLFRNLDGEARISRRIEPNVVRLHTHAVLRELSAVGEQILTRFELWVAAEDEAGQQQPVFEARTVFGAFPPAAMTLQSGLPPAPEQAALLTAAAVQTLPIPPGFTGLFHLLDAAELIHRDDAGNARLRGKRRIDLNDPLFQAHFYQDPVQPGSVGLQAMLQLAACLLATDAATADLELCTPGECDWRYRGQVLPSHGELTITAQLTPVGYDDRALLFALEASLWVEGTRVYEAKLKARQVGSKTWLRSPPARLDPAVDTWMGDHCPSYAIPVLPLMFLADRILHAGLPGEAIHGLEDLVLEGWVAANRPLVLRTERQGRRVRLMAAQEGEAARQVASAKLCLEPTPPSPPLPALGEIREDDIYADGRMFHGPAFQLVRRLAFTAHGASAALDTASPVPIGRAHPALLDAGIQAIPQDHMETWFPECPPGRLAIPLRMESLRIHGPPPREGAVRGEIRPDGCGGAGLLPRIRVQWMVDDQLWAEARMTAYLLPSVSTGMMDRRKRRAFLRDRVWFEDMRVSTITGPEETRLSGQDLRTEAWLPGDVAHIFGDDDPAEVLRREHIATAHRLHPSRVDTCLPLQQFDLARDQQADDYAIRGDGWGSLALDLGTLRRVRLSTPEVLEQARAAGVACGLRVMATPHARLDEAHAWTNAALHALGLELPVLGDSVEFCTQVQPAWPQGPLELVLGPLDAVSRLPFGDSVRVARAPHERAAIWAFRYDRYVEDWHHLEHIQADHAHHQLHAPSDDLPGAIHLYLGRLSAMQAVVSLQLWGAGEIPEKRARDLSFDRLPEAIASLCVAEIHKLGVHPDASGNPAIGAMLANLFERGARLGGEILFVECVASHVRQYLNLGFRPYGGRLNTHHRRGFSVPLIAFWDPEHQARLDGGLAQKVVAGLWPDGPARPQPTAALRARITATARQLVYRGEEVQREITAWLAKCPPDSPLRQLSPSQREAMLRQAWIVDIPAGTPLTTRGLREQEGFLLLKGSARVVDDAGRERRLSAGQIVGTESVLATDGLRQADAFMHQDGRVLVIQGAFLAQATRHPGADGAAWRTFCA